MVAEETREIALGGESHMQRDGDERFFGELDPARRFVHPEGIPVDVGSEVHLLLEQGEEMWAR